ncbi:MAG: hypothetical protein PHF11_01790 [Candidatus Omnitrophica bacterium]|nr:hypothetical protein [Candidatus Omnitrophota bacterium]
MSSMLDTTETTLIQTDIDNQDSSKTISPQVIADRVRKKLNGLLQNQNGKRLLSYRDFQGYVNTQFEEDPAFYDYELSRIIMVELSDLLREIGPGISVILGSDKYGASAFTKSIESARADGLYDLTAVFQEASILAQEALNDYRQFIAKAMNANANVRYLNQEFPNIRFLDPDNVLADTNVVRLKDALLLLPPEHIKNIGEILLRTGAGIAIATPGRIQITLETPSVAEENSRDNFYATYIEPMGINQEDFWTFTILHEIGHQVSRAILKGDIQKAWLQMAAEVGMTSDKMADELFANDYAYLLLKGTTTKWFNHMWYPKIGGWDVSGNADKREKFFKESKDLMGQVQDIGLSKTGIAAVPYPGEDYFKDIILGLGVKEVKIIADSLEWDGVLKRYGKEAHDAGFYGEDSLLAGPVLFLRSHQEDPGDALFIREAISHETVHLLHFVRYGMNRVQSDYLVLRKSYIEHNQDRQAAEKLFSSFEEIFDNSIAIAGGEFYSWFYGQWITGQIGLEGLRSKSGKGQTIEKIIKAFNKTADNATKDLLTQHYQNLGLPSGAKPYDRASVDKLLRQAESLYFNADDYVGAAKMWQEALDRAGSHLNEVDILGVNIYIAKASFLSGDYEGFIKNSLGIISKIYTNQYFQRDLRALKAMQLAAKIILGQIKITEANAGDFREQYKRDPLLGPLINGKANWGFEYYDAVETLKKWDGFNPMMDLINKAKDRSNVPDKPGSSPLGNDLQKELSASSALAIDKSDTPEVIAKKIWDHFVQLAKQEAATFPSRENLKLEEFDKNEHQSVWLELLTDDKNERLAAVKLQKVADGVAIGNIQAFDKNRRRGYGQALLEKLLEKYGTVYTGTEKYTQIGRDTITYDAIKMLARMEIAGKYNVENTHMLTKTVGESDGLSPNLPFYHKRITIKQPPRFKILHPTGASSPLDNAEAEFSAQSVELWRQWNEQGEIKAALGNKGAELTKQGDLILDGSQEKLEEATEKILQEIRDKQLWTEEALQANKYRVKYGVFILAENVAQHGENNGILVAKVDEKNRKVYVAVMDKGDGFPVDAATNIPIIQLDEDEFFNQREGSPGRGQGLFTLRNAVVPEEWLIYTRGYVWRKSDNKIIEEDKIKGLKGALSVIALDLGQPDKSASSPLEESTEHLVGLNAGVANAAGKIKSAIDKDKLLARFIDNELNSPAKLGSAYKGTATERLLEYFRKIAAIVQQASGHDFGALIYVGSGFGMTEAIPYSHRIITVDMKDIFDGIDKISVNTIADKLSTNFFNKVTRGMIPAKNNHGFIDYIVELLVSGADLDSLRVTEDRKIGDARVTTFEFNINGEKFVYTHYQYKIPAKFDRNNTADNFMQDYIATLTNGKLHSVFLSKAGAMDNGSSAYDLTRAFYGKVNDPGSPLYDKYILSEGTTIVTDNYGEESRYIAQADRRYQDLTPSAVSSLEELQYSLVGRSELSYGYAQDLKKILHIFRLGASASTPTEAWVDFKGRLADIIQDAALREGIFRKTEKLYPAYANEFVPEALTKGRLFVKVLYESLYSPDATRDYLSYDLTHVSANFMPIVRRVAKDTGLSLEDTEKLLDGFRKDYDQARHWALALNRIELNDVIQAVNELAALRIKYQDLFRFYAPLNEDADLSTPASSPLNEQIRAIRKQAREYVQAVAAEVEEYIRLAEWSVAASRKDRAAQEVALGYLGKDKIQSVISESKARGVEPIIIRMLQVTKEIRQNGQRVVMQPQLRIVIEDAVLNFCAATTVETENLLTINNKSKVAATRIKDGIDQLRLAMRILQDLPAEDAKNVITRSEYDPWFQHKIIAQANQPPASSPATERKDDKGGIDFRSLPIITQANTAVPAATWQAPPLAVRQGIPDDKEWLEIKRMLDAGIIPSVQRIKEYLESCCGKDNFDQQIDKVLSSVADILRLEEEQVLPTEPAFKEILVTLESGRSAGQIKSALNHIAVLAVEPKLIIR